MDKSIFSANFRMWHFFGQKCNFGPSAFPHVKRWFESIFRPFSWFLMFEMWYLAVESSRAHLESVFIHLGLIENGQIDLSIEISRGRFFWSIFLTSSSVRRTAHKSLQVAKLLPCPKSDQKNVTCENCHQVLIYASKVSIRNILRDSKCAHDSSNPRYQISVLIFLEILRIFPLDAKSS